MKLTQKKLTPTKRVCLRLREARIERGLNVQTMAVLTRMSREHVMALEECRFHDLPFAPVYQKNLIKAYILALGMEPREFVDQFVIEEMDAAARPQPENDSFHARTPNFPALLKVAGMTTILLGVVGYLLLQVRHIVEPPTLLVYSPENGMVTTEQIVIANGKTDKGVELNINGQQIINTEEGFFEQEVTLRQGVNTIVFSAKKKYGKPITQTRHIIYKKDQNVSLGSGSQPTL